MAIKIESGPCPIEPSRKYADLYDAANKLKPGEWFVYDDGNANSVSVAMRGARIRGTIPSEVILSVRDGKLYVLRGKAK